MTKKRCTTKCCKCERTDTVIRWYWGEWRNLCPAHVDNNDYSPERAFESLQRILLTIMAANERSKSRMMEMSVAEGLQAVASFTMALGLWRNLGSGRVQVISNQITADCHKEVIEAVSDADYCRVIKCLTGSNLRDQLSQEEAQDIYEDMRRSALWPEVN